MEKDLKNSLLQLSCLNVLRPVLDLYQHHSETVSDHVSESDMVAHEAATVEN